MEWLDFVALVAGMALVRAVPGSVSGIVSRVVAAMARGVATGAARVPLLGRSLSSSRRPMGRCPLASVRASIAGRDGAAGIKADCKPLSGDDANAAVTEWLESLDHQKPRD